VNPYDDTPTEELEAEEARISAEVLSLDVEKRAILEDMRVLQLKADPIRAELQRRRREKADNDPLTQNVGF